MVVSSLSNICSITFPSWSAATELCRIEICSWVAWAVRHRSADPAQKTSTRVTSDAQQPRLSESIYWSKASKVLIRDIPTQWTIVASLLPKDQTDGSQDDSCMTVPPGSKHGRSKDQTTSCGRLFERRQCCQPTRTILPEKPGRTGGDEESWNSLLLPHFSLCQITDSQGPSRTYTKNVQAHLKGQVCTKEVGLQPLWWFHSHLHPVLQHAHGEMRWRPKHKES